MHANAVKTYYECLSPARRRTGDRVFSSNYALYGDMSRRVNDIYRNFSPRIEIYSIDESFIDLTDVRPQMREEMARDTDALASLTSRRLIQDQCALE